MRYFTMMFLVGVTLLAQQADKPQQPTNSQSQKSDTSNNSKKTTTKGKSKKALSDWKPCTLPPKTDPWTFWKTCKEVKLNGCVIQASCLKKDQSWRNTSFDTNLIPKCYTTFMDPANLTNEDGKLCCGYAGRPSICGP